MPELIEVETYRRVAHRAVGRTIADVPVADDLGRRRDLPPTELAAALRGATILGTRRIGKLLLLDTDGPVVGMRFGMTGRLIVDGDAAIDRLEYGGHRDEPAWDRFVFTFTAGGDLRLRDPRRLGGVELDPDEGALGPDATAVTAADLRLALTGSLTPLKARLLDQSRIAGLGNLLVDEALWRAGLDPTTPSDHVARTVAAPLARTIRTTVAALTRRGGSHLGDLQVARVPGARCPRDGAALRRDTVGGRTTYWCPRHQVRP